MNLEEIKEIIQKEGGKIVIVEQDKPQMVIMSFEEWRRAKKAGQAFPSPRAQEQPASLPDRSGASTDEAGGLTIDDLPL